MNPPPQGLRPASPSVTQLATTTAHLWRMGRSPKSSSTPRPSTQVALPATGCLPPHHSHIITEEAACPKALGRWLGHGLGPFETVAQSWGQSAWPWMDSGQSLKLRTAGQLQARCCPPPPFSATAHAMHSSPRSAGAAGPLLQPSGLPPFPVPLLHGASQV